MDGKKEVIITISKLNSIEDLKVRDTSMINIIMGNQFCSTIVSSNIYEIFSSMIII